MECKFNYIALNEVNIDLFEPIRNEIDEVVIIEGKKSYDIWVKKIQ